MGVDNDELICELARPPLSSESLNAFGAGYNTAKLLDGLMKKKICKARRVPIEATGVVTWRSSDTIAIDDADVVNAIQFIRRTMGETLSVDRVVRESALSRQALERRFRNTLGRTVHEEFQLSRLNCAK